MKNDKEIDSAVGLPRARKLAEQQLLSLVREEDSNGFTLTMTFSDGRWVISLDDLNTGASSVGRGDSFAEAWHGQDPQWPRQG